MKINGREIGLLYTVGAHLDFNDWVVLHQKASMATANMQRAIACHRAYLESEGSDEKPITVEEIRRLPKYVYDELIEETMKAVEAGSKREVELAEQKNAESATT